MNKYIQYVHGEREKYIFVHFLSLNEQIKVYCSPNIVMFVMCPLSRTK